MYVCVPCVVMYMYMQMFSEMGSPGVGANTQASWHEATELGSSTRTVNTPNFWAISPAPSAVFWVLEGLWKHKPDWWGKLCSTDL